MDNKDYLVNLLQHTSGRDSFMRYLTEVDAMTQFGFLKYLSKGWFGNSRQHSIHAQLLKARGLNKPADKIMAGSDEEWEDANKVNARLIGMDNCLIEMLGD